MPPSLNLSATLEELGGLLSYAQDEFMRSMDWKSLSQRRVGRMIPDLEWCSDKSHRHRLEHHVPNACAFILEDSNLLSRWRHASAHHQALAERTLTAADKLIGQALRQFDDWYLKGGWQRAQVSGGGGGSTSTSTSSRGVSADEQQLKNRGDRGVMGQLKGLLAISPKDHSKDVILHRLQLAVDAAEGKAPQIEGHKNRTTQEPAPWRLLDPSSGAPMTKRQLNEKIVNLDKGGPLLLPRYRRSSVEIERLEAQKVKIAEIKRNKGDPNFPESARQFL